MATGHAAERKAFPNRPIKVIVPFAPGGGSDTFARIIQQAIRDHGLLPQPLVIYNVPGAGGTIGSRQAKDAVPDGYTLLFLHEGILTAKWSGQAKYGAEAFTPIAATGSVGLLIGVREDSPFQDLAGLVEAAAANPETIPFAANLGAPSHFSALRVEQARPGARFRFVQSGGGAERFAALKGGHVAASAFSVAEHLTFKDGGLRAVAYLGEERHPALPDVPTGREQGIDVLAGNIQCWWAPRGTPPEKVRVIAEALEAAMALPEVRERLAKLQVEPDFLTGSALAAELRRREETMAKVAIRRSGHVPNFPALAGWATLAAAGLALIRTWNRRRKHEPERKGVGAPTEFQPGSRLGRRAWGLAGLTVVYLVLFQAGVPGYAWSTAVFAAGAACLLTPRLRMSAVITYVAMGVLLGFGCFQLFTRVLTVNLH